MSELLSSISLLQKSLSYHNSRHAVIASNIANAQTPGYRPKDVSFTAAMKQAEKMEATSEAHFISPDGTSATTKVFDDGVVAPGADGNAVSMERQMAKMTANSVRYRALAEMLSRRLAMIRYAATDGRR